jgi:hypothetical protein
VLSVIFAAAVATPSPSPAPLPPQATPVAERKVCHVEPIQGSRITHKVCLSPAEAQLLAREARDLLDHAQAGYQPPNMANMVSMTPAR